MHIYIVNIYIVGDISKQATAHFFALKWFEALIYKINNFICTP